MCGIAGFWGPPDRALLEAMTESLRHRGPDDDGYFEDATASLGFRRLSIIDLEHGSQPMSMDDGRLQIVYNGEVYNFRELRAELEALGHTFHTTCDTEVVLHAYAEWGTDCFRRFNGMWGLAILDERAPAPRLVLARDHFGIKPLFYARHRGRVVFASEIKAILQDETFPREVDEQQMYEYLRFGLFDHNDGTFFRGIRQVPAAAFAVIEGGAISETVYWTPRLSEDGDASPEAFRAVFERAVQRRLVADVPVGICLSGGLDSSSICTVMAQQLHDHVRDTESLGDRLKTFSAVFPGDRIDESALHQERPQGDRRRQQRGAAHRPGLHPRARGVGLAHGGADGVVGALRHVDGDATGEASGHGHARRPGGRRVARRVRPLPVCAAPPAAPRAPLW